MLGQIKWYDGRKLCLEEELMLGLPTLALYLPQRQRGGQRRLQRGVEQLLQRRVRRVLAQPAFPHWPLLRRWGLQAVDTKALRCALAPLWVRTALAAQGLSMPQATLRLTGRRENGDMVRLAHLLCPQVRGLVIETAGPGQLASRLHREYGLPILPPTAHSDLTLSFDAGPVLTGASFSLARRELPDCDPLPLLTALWEGGRLALEDIQLEVS